MNRRFKTIFFTKIFKEIFTKEMLIKFLEIFDEKYSSDISFTYYYNMQHKRRLRVFNNEYIDNDKKCSKDIITKFII